MGALLLGAAVASGFASRAAQPYSGAHPKRVLVQHLHLLGPWGNVQARGLISRLIGSRPRALIVSCLPVWPPPWPTPGGWRPV